MNSVAFGLTFAITFFYILHGKPLADVLFNKGSSVFTASFNHLRVYLALLAMVITFTMLRISAWPVRLRSILAIAASIAGPLAVQLQADEASPMIFVLDIYLSLVATAIITVEPVFTLEVRPEFWKGFFSITTKAAGYIFTLFSAGLAILQYVSKGLKETIPGYLTSLAYPAGALLFSTAAILYWIITPAWEKYLATVRT